MPQPAQDLVVAKYQASGIESLRKLAERIRISPGSNGQEFIKNVARLDSVRSQNFSKTHPEIATAMGYCF
jgi:hypothetical protein